MDFIANYLFSGGSSVSADTDHLVGFDALSGGAVGAASSCQALGTALGTASSDTTLRHYILINTLPADQQDCLIKGTLSADQEERAINDALTKYVPGSPPFECIIYGANCCDLSPDNKRRQLLELGFGLKEVKIYRGGMFEWLLLQDIYGCAKFATTKKELNLLKYNVKV
jgi:hypothetical protein